MSDKRDYYEVLGISKNASDDEIKKAYKSLAKKYHPDLNPGDAAAEAKFKELGEAYGVLSNPEMRARYDQYGHEAVDGSGGAGAGGYGFGGMDFGDLGDIFSSFFGGGGGFSSRGQAQQRGQSIGVSVTVAFEEAALGCKKEIKVSRTERCDDCGGSGAEKGTVAEECSVCHGTGRVYVMRNMGIMQMRSEQTCSACRGTGKNIKNPCKKCNGSGQKTANAKLEVNIPAGIDDGQRLTLRGQGNAGKFGAPSGDLIIEVRVRPHALFKRDGNRLLLNLPITFVEAALGATVTVPTLEKDVELKIPEGTQTGTTFSLRNKGIPNINSSGRGDLYVTVNVEVPKNLNSKQRQALMDFGDLCNNKNYTKKQSFFDKFKK